MRCLKNLVIRRLRVLTLSRCALGDSIYQVARSSTAGTARGGSGTARRRRLARHRRRCCDDDDDDTRTRAPQSRRPPRRHRGRTAGRCRGWRRPSSRPPGSAARAASCPRPRSRAATAPRRPRPVREGKKERKTQAARCVGGPAARDCWISQGIVSSRDTREDKPDDARGHDLLHRVPAEFVGVDDREGELAARAAHVGALELDDVSKLAQRRIGPRVRAQLVRRQRAGRRRRAVVLGDRVVRADPQKHAHEHRARALAVDRLFRSGRSGRHRVPREKKREGES
mmetsp:Transcript_26655/g.106773  ORF Transcript_26655/g.106773 Transcript_26655/m.106773 type:complete len:284 (+) Transcript_26655:1148-1999(+)